LPLAELRPLDRRTHHGEGARVLIRHVLGQRILERLDLATTWCLLPSNRRVDECPLLRHERFECPERLVQRQATEASDSAGGEDESTVKSPPPSLCPFSEDVGGWVGTPVCSSRIQIVISRISRAVTAGLRWERTLRHFSAPSSSARNAMMKSSASFVASSAGVSLVIAK